MPITETIDIAIAFNIKVVQMPSTGQWIAQYRAGHHQISDINKDKNAAVAGVLRQIAERVRKGEITVG